MTALASKKLVDLNTLAKLFFRDASEFFWTSQCGHFYFKHKKTGWEVSFQNILDKKYIACVPKGLNDFMKTTLFSTRKQAVEGMNAMLMGTKAEYNFSSFKLSSNNRYRLEGLGLILVKTHFGWKFIAGNLPQIKGCFSSNSKIFQLVGKSSKTLENSPIHYEHDFMPCYMTPNGSKSFGVSLKQKTKIIKTPMLFSPSPEFKTRIKALEAFHAILTHEQNSLVGLDYLFETT